MENLREVDCDVLTLGQYLCPSPRHREVSEYLHPRRFEDYKSVAEQLGFKAVASGPFVRSSLNALVLFRKAQKG